MGKEITKKSKKTAVAAADPVQVKTSLKEKVTKKKTAVKAPKVEEVAPKTKKSKKAVVVAKPESSSDSSSSDEDTVAPVAAAAVESSGSESSDEEMAAPAAVAAAADSDSSSSSSDDEPEVAKVEAAADDSDSSSSSDDEETAVVAKEADAASESGSSSSDSDEEKTAEKRKAQDSSSDSSSSDDEEVAVAAAPVKKQKVEEAPQAAVSATCFVGNLSWNVTEEALAEAFGSCGEVISARIITDKQTGKAKGFGYVEFTTTEASQKAIETMNEYELDGRGLRVDISTPKPVRENTGNGRVEKPQSNPSNILFLGNLSFNVTEDSIRAEFSKIGQIVSLRFPTDRETGAFKGFGYLEFSDVETAKSAVDTLNGHSFDGRAIRIDYSQPRDNAAGGSRGGRGGFGGSRGAPRGRGGFGGGRGAPRGGRGGFGAPRGGRGGFGGNSRGGFGGKPAGTKTTFE